MKRLLWGLLLCGALAAQVKLPPYTREVLPNGTVTYYMQRSGIPLVRFLVVVKGGSESDPLDRAGLASVTAELLRRGTAQYSAAQFSEAVDDTYRSALIELGLVLLLVTIATNLAAHLLMGALSGPNEAGRA